MQLTHATVTEPLLVYACLYLNRICSVNNLNKTARIRDFILLTECEKIADLIKISLDQPTGIFSGE